MSFLIPNKQSADFISCGLEHNAKLSKNVTESKKRSFVDFDIFLCITTLFFLFSFFFNLQLLVTWRQSMQRMHSLCLFLILLSHCIAITQQQCLNTTTVNGGSYSFALALVNDLSNPLGPQEACYYSCGAEIVTHSANTGFMAELTWMDKAAQDLAASGFLQRGKAYILVSCSMTELGLSCSLTA